MNGCTDKFINRIRNNDILIFGCVMDSRSGAIIEAYKETGYDVVFIDCEHTALNTETILEHIRIARALDFPCMVRTADHSYAQINRLMDQAPDGIFIPRIRTRKEVEEIYQMVKYPPLGIRGLGASTCPVAKYMGWNSVQEQIDYVNKKQVFGIQIETADALKNIEDILSMPGIDIAVIGPDDLCISMGIAGKRDHTDYQKALDRVVAVCNKYNVMPGISCGDPAEVLTLIKRGFRAFWYAADICLLWQKAKEQISALGPNFRKLKKE
jgi:2-dehydro-3-deoxyglucarate aldolase/4-hydroxy-2-oxoheptanedioate aldolase